MDIPTTGSSTAGSLRHWFESALDQPLSERQAWLTQHCADTVMRVRVRALLAAHTEAATGLLDVPVVSVIDALHDDADTAPPESLVGTRIGAFRLLRPLGQGGMATVFLAEREDVDFRQRVAVKLLRRGLYSDFEQQLFTRERRTLATLSHPDIARLIDGGVTDSGIPYLVMDYIDGVPITRYATERQLDLRARLVLFHHVCQAVAAAHRQLVVHRDLKPANIIVTHAGEAKLLDFGIAKLLDDNGEDGDNDPAISALTPGYAAPEQYAGGPISTATDVYALGVLLHELLLGERPASTDAQPPSRRVAGTDPAPLPLPASHAQLHSALRGDLDCILRKTLAVDPECRYPSAGALAAETLRYLRNEPIMARPQSAAYRMQKFVQRHRGGVSIVAMLALAVLTSLTVAVWQAQVARTEASHARTQAVVAMREAQRANAVRDLLVQLFENERPGGARQALPDTATLLQRGAERARKDLSATPALQAEMLVLIGRIHDQLSRFDDARPLLVQAVAIARRLPAQEQGTLAEALSQLGQLDLSEKRYAQALPHLQEALTLQQRIDPKGLATALTLHRRALLYSETDQHAAAIADFRAALAIRQTRLRPRDPRLIQSHGALGLAYVHAHQPEQAMPWLQSALSLARQVHGDVHEETARRLSNLGISLLALGRHEEAERAFAEAVAIDRQVYASPNAAAAPHVHNLGNAQLALGRLDEAEASLRESLAIEQAIRNQATPGPGFALAKLARIQEWRGDLAGALALATESQRILSATLSPTHTVRLDAELRTLRLRLLQSGRVDLRKAAADLRNRVDALAPPERELDASARYVQGLALVQAGNDREGEQMIEQALRMTDGRRSLPEDSLTWFAMLAQVREQRGDHQGASNALRDGLAYADRSHIPPAHPARAALNRKHADR